MSEDNLPSDANDANSNEAPLYGISARLPADVLAARNNARKPRDIELAFLLDATESMRGALDSIKRNILSVVEILPNTSRIAIIIHTDVHDPYVVHVVQDFTRDKAVLVNAVNRILTLGGGDYAEAQYSGFAHLLSNSVSWSSKCAGLVIHITDAPPHTLEAEQDGKSSRGNRDREKRIFQQNPKAFPVAYDWVKIGRALANKGIMVATFLIQKYGLPYYLAMSVLTSGPGVFHVANGSQIAISDQVLTLIDFLKASHSGKQLSVEQAAILQLEIAHPDSASQILAAKSEDDIRGILRTMPSSKVSGADALEPVESALSGLIRLDGSVKRFLKAEGSVEDFEIKLKQSGRDLQVLFRCLLSDLSLTDKLEELLSLENQSLYQLGLRLLNQENVDRDCTFVLPPDVAKKVAEPPTMLGVDGDGPRDAFTTECLKGIVLDFCNCEDIGLAHEKMDILFGWISSLYIGFPILCPFFDGKFNYEDGWVLHIKDVRRGYDANYQAFLDYVSAIHGGWVASGKEDLQRTVNDLLLRDDGKMTGIIPKHDGQAITGFVLRALARTPWLDTIVWHSICRHALPVPQAAAATLSCTFTTVLEQCTKRQEISDSDFELLSSIVMVLRLLPKPSAASQRGILLKWMFSETQEEIAHIFSVQQDMHLSKIVVLLAQIMPSLFSMAPNKTYELCIMILGEVMAMLLDSHIPAEQRPVAQFLQYKEEDWFSNAPLEELHWLEDGDGELPELLFEIPERYMKILTKCEWKIRKLIHIMGIASDLSLSAMQRQAILMECLFWNERKNRAHVDVVQSFDEKKELVIKSNLQVPPFDDKQSVDNMNHYFREFLKKKHNEDLRILKMKREQHLIDTVVIPSIVNSLFQNDQSVFLDALNQVYKSEVVPEARIGMHHVGAICSALIASSERSINEDLLILLVCGCLKPYGPVLWGDGKMFLNAKLVKDVLTSFSFPNTVGILARIQEIWDCKNPSGSVPIAGSCNFNNRMARMCIEIVRLLALEWTNSKFLCTREHVARARTIGMVRLEMNLIDEFGDALFLKTKKDVVVIWSLGRFEREKHLVNNRFRYPWPYEFELLMRKREVMMFPKKFRKYLPSFQENPSLRGHSLPSEEIEVAALSVMKRRALPMEVES